MANYDITFMRRSDGTKEVCSIEAASFEDAVAWAVASVYTGEAIASVSLTAEGQEAILAAEARRGHILYDATFGHVCSCTERTAYDPLGNPERPIYENTVQVDRNLAPTESGSYYYVCSRCGAGEWSGC